MRVFIELIIQDFLLGLVYLSALKILDLKLISEIFHFYFSDNIDNKFYI